MKQISDELYARMEYLGLIDESGVRDHNAGTSDYKDFLIQPWAIWIDHDLNGWEGDIIKRVLRCKEGDPRRLDLEKIKHDCDELIRQIDIKEKYIKEFGTPVDGDRDSA